MLPPSFTLPEGGKGWLIAAAVGASVLLNAVLLVRGRAMEEPEAGPDLVGESSSVMNAPVPPSEVPPLPAPLGIAGDTSTVVYTSTITSSLSAAFQGVTVGRPAAVSAVFSRLFVWDVDVRRDLQRGDSLTVLYRQPDAGEPVVLAAQLRLANRGDSGGDRTLTAYRFQAPGDRYPSFWTRTGEEVPRQLIDGPMTEYEQITSLLKDRPTHAGMDFKAPVGAPVLAPRAGTVTRTNWKAANGNCVEVRFQDGTSAKFLHLNEVLVKDGQAVSAGTEIGKVGNTGHSTGPHLHYQLEQGGRVLDPVAYHGTVRRQLSRDTVGRLLAPVAAEYDAQLEQRVAAR